MARIEDEIGKIREPELRKAILEEVRKLKDKKQFGLVFEEHLPELVPIYKAPVRPKSTVSRKTGNLNETWQVARVKDGMAELVKDADGSREALPVKDLTVVNRFGEPIYPALTPMGTVENSGGNLWHTLIEADNYHALQLLEYLYAGQVDCFYLDPPYNTGARDWKYNNDYVDSNDTWRHSKWLSMMKKRLQLARHLLKPDGVLIVTIDDYELSHLTMLLQEIFPEFEVTPVVIEHNKRGRRGKNFKKSHEYAVFLVRNGLEIISEELLSEIAGGETRNLRRTGRGSRRPERQKLFYPIFIDDDLLEVKYAGPPVPLGTEYSTERDESGYLPIWPIDKDGEERVWYYGADNIKDLIADGKIYARHQNYGIQLYYTLREKDSKKWKTVWSKSTLDASTHGTELLTSILGKGALFDFPKSLYAVMDCLFAAVGKKRNALVIDFFAGSGTTLNALNMLNYADGGSRCCILVTNNEVSEKEAQQLIHDGEPPGNEAWDSHGICRSVTFPRSKYTILGRRDDGTDLDGECLTGRTVTKEKPRSIRQLGFTEGRLLSLVQRKQLVSLIEGVTQSKITAEMPFFIDDESPASILFDIRQADVWIEALEEQEQVTELYIVTQETRLFNTVKQRIQEQMGPVLMEEEEKRPMKDGFAANLEYFKLDFLDPHEIAMGRQFAAVLPILWMMAGAKVKRPEAPDARAHWLLPDGCPFVVLIQETYFRDFLPKIEGRTDLTHIFLVTDSERAFHEMQEELQTAFDGVRCVQLYKSYLDNFKINTGRNRP